MKLQKSLSKSALVKSTNFGDDMKSLVRRSNKGFRQSKGNSQLRIRYSESGRTCVVKTVAVAVRGRVQLQMIFDPSYYYQ